MNVNSDIGTLRVKTQSPTFYKHEKLELVVCIRVPMPKESKIRNPYISCLTCSVMWAQQLDPKKISIKINATMMSLSGRLSPELKKLNPTLVKPEHHRVSST